MEWYREVRDTATTPSQHTFTQYGTFPNTVPKTDYNSKITFSSIAIGDEGFYSCNITYKKTGTFPGGSIISNTAAVTVIQPGTLNMCVIKHCDAPDVNCTGQFHDITAPVKPCTYQISLEEANNRKSTTTCEEPSKGCCFVFLHFLLLFLFVEYF